MKDILSLFSPAYPKTLIYMLQSTEYLTRSYLGWYWRTSNFNAIERRRALDRTRAARLLLFALRLGILIQIFGGLLCVYLWLKGRLYNGWMLGLGLFISYPIVWAHIIIIPLVPGRLLIVRPRQKRQIKVGERIFAEHPGIKIAVAGSYGKTSMKELLATVLSTGKKVAASPANKNTLESHGAFATKLEGDEDVLIIEYGEGRPGDIARFTAMTHPTHGIITGLAPAHLDQYVSLEAAATDIFTLADYLQGENIYINGESEAASSYIQGTYHVYGRGGLDQWRVSRLKTSLEGVRFTLSNSKHSLKLTSGLLGRHQVGPLVAAAVLGFELGLDSKTIETAVASTMPYEHRMQPYQLAGAWIVDDTYNGNIEGVKAGLALLSDLPAIRKMYVTPGLVDQGRETQMIHEEMGRLIARSNPDRVVLMDNSVTKHIYAGLAEAGYPGEVQIEDNPLAFYTNLDQFVAAGDLVLMQNDWTDNYH